MTTNSAAAGRARSAKSNSENPPAKRARGFAAMDPAQQRRIASEGGRASHQSGRGHRFTPEEARAAGRKGGQASRGRSNQDTPAAV
ncbi:KGG domain-containing protein [Hymenobacter fodinae]|uniref:General stress protein n=1 Tax=Hymenobacter fodinae TaxID=2510796 RepID=A0A4Z0P511_9BACT|nr:KGG domain-containing protein [Hymenobacter fodinae]TGE06500.1 general stress protein [Hymenobacter fodinae]